LPHPASNIDDSTQGESLGFRVSGNSALSTDQRNTPFIARDNGNGVDIGAFEFYENASSDRFLRIAAGLVLMVFHLPLTETSLSLLRQRLLFQNRLRYRLASCGR